MLLFRRPGCFRPGVELYYSSSRILGAPHPAAGLPITPLGGKLCGEKTKNLISNLRMCRSPWQRLRSRYRMWRPRRRSCLRLRPLRRPSIDADCRQLFGVPAVSAPAARNSASVIGSGLKIQGEITGDSDLVVEGEAHGRIRMMNGRVTVAANGRVNADIEAVEITVEGCGAGRIEGQRPGAIGTDEPGAGQRDDAANRDRRWSTFARQSGNDSGG